MNPAEYVQLFLATVNAAATTKQKGLRIDSLMCYDQTEDSGNQFSDALKGLGFFCPPFQYQLARKTSTHYAPADEMVGLRILHQGPQLGEKCRHIAGVAIHSQGSGRLLHSFARWPSYTGAIPFPEQASLSLRTAYVSGRKAHCTQFGPSRENTLPVSSSPQSVTSAG